ncbi:MAG: hypothetical protein R3C05_09375 [Pirellulaceae bacterium]
MPTFKWRSYAAALRVLTRYSTIDGRDMASESIRPLLKVKSRSWMI